jgi:hypothetical protein
MNNMSPTSPQAPEQDSPIAYSTRNMPQSQSSETEPTDTMNTTIESPDSDTTPQNPNPNPTPQPTTYATIRDDDKRRYAAGGRPGPDWKDPVAMKTWLELRFPQGTKEGSPYYQFLITSSRFEDTYWLPGRGSEQVVGKLSEKEWKRWSAEKAGLVMHSSWGQDPLYPDRDDSLYQTAIDDLISSYSRPQRLAQERNSAANVNQADEVEDGGIPSRMEEYPDTDHDRSESAHSSSKRTADDAQLDFEEPPVKKKIKVSPKSATFSPNIHAIPNNASSPKKRKANDTESDTDDSPDTKRSRRSPRPSRSYRSVDTDLTSLIPPSDRSNDGIEHAPQSTSPPPENGRANRLEDNPQLGIKPNESQDEEVTHQIPPSNPQHPLDPPKAENALPSNQQPAKKKANTKANKHINPNTPHLKNATTTPTLATPQTPAPQNLPTPPKTHPPPSKNPPKRLSPPKKRRHTAENPVSQTQYTTRHLRSGVGKRRHTLPSKSW